MLSDEGNGGGAMPPAMGSDIAVRRSSLLCFKCPFVFRFFLSALNLCPALLLFGHLSRRSRLVSLSHWHTHILGINLPWIDFTNYMDERTSGFGCGHSGQGICERMHMKLGQDECSEWVEGTVIAGSSSRKNVAVVIKLR